MPRVCAESVQLIEDGGFLPELVRRVMEVELQA
jgi:hypothetical protein